MPQKENSASHWLTFFVAIMKTWIDRIEDAEWVPNANDAERQAKMVMDQVNSPEEFKREMFAAISLPLVMEFVEGATAQIDYLSNLLKSAAVHYKQLDARTTAEEAAEKYDIDVTDLLAFIDGFDVSLRRPQWMIDEAMEALAETIAMDYWDDINKTFAGRAETMLAEGVERGYSISRIAKELRIASGSPDDPWIRTRTKNIARTETGAMLNRGAITAMHKTSEETGLNLVSMWDSVLGSTTRPSHADMHGKVENEKGMFVLNGVSVPYPSHPDLPPSDRCNCQCGLLAAMPEMVVGGEVPVQEEAAGLSESPHIQPQRTEELCGGLAKGVEFKAASKCGLSKSEIAKTSAKRVGKNIQRYSEELNEAALADELKAKAIDDNAPHDVLWMDGKKPHAIELKTMVDNANGKITMKRSAMERKAQWMKKNKGAFHTVVFDDAEVIPGRTIAAKSKALNRYLETGDSSGFDFSKRKIFYRRGFGSFRVANMHEVEGGTKGLQKLMRQRVTSLPEGAR
jgi:hypothetical protein